MASVIQLPEGYTAQVISPLRLMMHVFFTSVVKRSAPVAQKKGGSRPLHFKSIGPFFFVLFVVPAVFTGFFSPFQF
jgi:hypothetical protein